MLRTDPRVQQVMDETGMGLMQAIYHVRSRDVVARQDRRIAARITAQLRVVPR